MFHLTRMPNHASPLCPFTVFQFSLDAGGAKRPTQRSRTCGSFSSIEEAFFQARMLAEEIFATLTPHETYGAPEMIDTEWGYDLRLGALTVHRFWVHESFSTQSLLS